ncbi:MAG: 50S ribosomal protein L18 [bacterium]
MLKKVLLITTKERRIKRVRGVLKGSLLPRVSIFKSNKGIYAQLIDDLKAHTLAAVSPKDGATATELGEKMAQKALKVKVKRAKFDRGGYKYHGKVKEFCEGLRQGGLKI